MSRINKIRTSYRLRRNFEKTQKSFYIPFFWRFWVLKKLSTDCFDFIFLGWVGNAYTGSFLSLGREALALEIWGMMQKFSFWTCLNLMGLYSGNSTCRWENWAQWSLGLSSCRGALKRLYYDAKQQGPELIVYY